MPVKRKFDYCFNSATVTFKKIKEKVRQDIAAEAEDIKGVFRIDASYGGMRISVDSEFRDVKHWKRIFRALDAVVERNLNKPKSKALFGKCCSCEKRGIMKRKAVFDNKTVYICSEKCGQDYNMAVSQSY